MRDTASDALVSKLSCSLLGYSTDRFLPLIVRGGARRSPLINRGYYARVAAVDTLLSSFLLTAAGDSPIILSLGAGLDTTYFRHSDLESFPPGTSYVEVDFEETCAKKSRLLQRSVEFTEILGDFTCSGTELYTTDGSYSLVSADMADISAFEAALVRAQADLSSRPVFVLSECVMVYMDYGDSARLVEYLGSVISYGAFVSYEQIHPDDAFGQVMVRNMKERGCTLRGIYDNLDEQEKRFLTRGWQFAKACDMNWIYRKFIDPTDKLRIEKLEMFDEYEEWHLMMAHYSITVAGKGDEFSALLDIKQ